VTCALRLGVDAFPASQVSVKCPDCQQVITDRTAHALACCSVEAQTTRTRLHTAMDVAVRVLLHDLDPECIVTGAKDAYPADHGMAVSRDYPEAVNHRADAYVEFPGRAASHLIDFTFTNSAKSTGKDGMRPGGHADEMDDAKMAMYRKQFPGLKADSSPALVILSMERHGSMSKGTREYWDARLQHLSNRIAHTEFPTHLSVLTRRVLQTLAIALRRVNAGHILQFHRRSTYGAQRVGRPTKAKVAVAMPVDEGDDP
jgi:hypothetical protein